jgi:hypothetical protein
MELHYSTFDSELLAHSLSILHFCHYCEGRLFQRWMDHKPLMTTISRVTTPILPKKQHHLAFIYLFNVQMLYLPGLQNVIADVCPAPQCH